jgi:hypothetical protein
MNNNRQKVPWYKWRFSFAGCYFILLFSWCAWSAYKKSNMLTKENIGIVAVFLLLAILFIWLEWKNRKPIKFNLGQSKKEIIIK